MLHKIWLLLFRFLCVCDPLCQLSVENPSLQPPRWLMVLLVAWVFFQMVWIRWHEQSPGLNTTGFAQIWTLHRYAWPEKPQELRSIRNQDASWVKPTLKTRVRSLHCQPRSNALQVDGKGGMCSISCLDYLFSLPNSHVNHMESVMEGKGLEKWIMFFKPHQDLGETKYPVRPCYIRVIVTEMGWVRGLNAVFPWRLHTFGTWYPQEWAQL